MSEFIRDKAGATEAQQKKALAYLFKQDSVGLASDGVIAGLTVAQTGTASASVLIAAGAGVSQDTVGNGAALLVNDTQKTLDILTANPMGGTPRNDIVAFDSATSAIGVIVGTPNAVPTDPTVPATAIPLARLRHAASATTVPTAKIDQLGVPTGLAESPVAGNFSNYQTGGQSILAATVTALRWDAPTEATAGLTVAAISRTVTVAGVYAISASVTVGATQTTRAYIEAYGGTATTRTPFTGDNRGGAALTVRLAVGDVIKAEVYCATATTTTGGYLSAYRIGT